MKMKAFILALFILTGVCLAPIALAAETLLSPDLAAAEETSAEPAAAESNSFTIDMSFAGDCLLATYKGQYYKGSFSYYADTQPPSYFFEKVYDVFSKDDFTIVNLENVLTDRNLKETKKPGSPVFWFKAPTTNANILTAGSIEGVSLANNHAYDYGVEGWADTVTALKNVGMPYGTNEETLYLEKNGFRIAVICCVMWNEEQANPIVTRIQEASEQSDYQIVFYHGGKEASHKPEEWRIRASHKLVEAGADLILGNHPHWLQPVENYWGVDIVYSLGNFCFGGNRKPENRTIIYKMVLTVQDGVIADRQASILPCYVYTDTINNWQPALITDETQKQRVLDFMSGNASLPY